MSDYTAPTTHHPRRCYCPKFAPGHTPGLEPRYGNECTGDTDVEHDATSCPACLAGATDYRPRIEPGQIWISQYGSDHEVIERADDARHEMWEMRGPVGNLYVLTAEHLYTGYTLDLDH